MCWRAQNIIIQWMETTVSKWNNDTIGLFTQIFSTVKSLLKYPFHRDKDGRTKMTKILSFCFHRCH